MTTTTIGARRKLASDIRPGDTFSEAFGNTFTARTVSDYPLRGIVRIRTAEGVMLTLARDEAVTPC